MLESEGGRAKRKGTALCRLHFALSLGNAGPLGSVPLPCCWAVLCSWARWHEVSWGWVRLPGKGVTCVTSPRYLPPCGRSDASGSSWRAQASAPGLVKAILLVPGLSAAHQAHRVYSLDLDPRVASPKFLPCFGAAFLWRAPASPPLCTQAEPQAEAPPGSGPGLLGGGRWLPDLLLVVY